MSEQPDEKRSPDDIDVIRDLLRKLEEVAAKDAEKPVEAIPSLPVIAPRNDLASLSRTGAPSGIPVAHLPQLVPQSAREMVRVEPELPTALTELTGERPARSGFAVAAMSFGLGIATAVGVLFAFGPLGNAIWPARKAVEPPAATVASAPAETPVASPRMEAPRPPVEPDRPAIAAVAAPTTPEPAAAAPAPVVAAPQPAAPAEIVVEVPAPGAVLPAGLPPIDMPPPPPPLRVAAPPPAPAPAPAPAPTQSPARVATPAPTPPAKAGGSALALPARVAMRAGERKRWALRIEPAPASDSSLLLVIRDVPAWLTFSKGGALGGNVWFMPANAADDLEWIAASGAEGTARLKVQLAAADGRIVTETETTVEASRIVTPQPAPMVAEHHERTEPDLQRLLARGALLIDTGEIEAARTLLRSAAEAGSVAAALKLAETYDPGQVARLGMAVTSADPLLAVRWYVHAEALGSQVASARLAALGRR